MSRKVAIVGFADSYALAPFDDPSVEIWGINELHKYLPRWDRWFELHAREAFEIKGDRDQTAHVNWLRAQAPVGDPAHKPIFMRELFADIPAGVVYPLAHMSDRFFARFGQRPYFTSSIGFMLAMAIDEGRDEAFRPNSDQAVSWIGLYGIDLAAASEYGEQRPNAEYFIGLARGLGIEVAIAVGSALLRADHVYGFESREEKEGLNGEAFLQARIREIEEQRNKVICTLNTLDGMKDECDYHLKRFEHARRGVVIKNPGAAA
jgi:hypothetical protein